MSLLEEIQNAAVDSKSDLAEVLRKCKILAVRLDSKPLADWLIWESEGYPPDALVPDYRIWEVEAFGHFSGWGGKIMRNMPLHINALAFLNDEIKESYRHYKCRDSVASVEATLREVKGNVQISTGQLAVRIGTRLYTDYNCIQAWAEYHPSRLVELINSVRNRVLDFVLAINKEAPNAGEIDGATAVKPEPGRVNQIFNTTVYGGSANLVGAAMGSTVEFNIGAKDFSALERVLTDKGISADDISELKQALESDPPPATPEKLGPKVSSWIGKMTNKAAQGAWKIGAGAAASLLAQVIARYYGLL